MTYWSYGRPQLSPYNSMTGGIPSVTDDDFSYITSDQIEPTGYRGPGHSYSHGRYRSTSAAPPGSPPVDDVLLVKHQGITYPAHFPAYAIGDGKLKVKDVKERMALLIDLPRSASRDFALYYKGRELKDRHAPIRDYGVKDKSELMAVLSGISDHGAEQPQPKKKAKKRKEKRGRRREEDQNAETDSLSSPPTSIVDGGSSIVDGSSSVSAPTQPSSGPMLKLDDLAKELNNKWLPLCDRYMANPPRDEKKREEEHRRLSESLLQHIILKLDGVESEGIAEVKLRRREMIHQTQAILKKLDSVKATGEPIFSGP